MKRFHLSTLLLLTVLAGAFVGANCWERRTRSNAAALNGTAERGWPLTFYKKDLRGFEDTKFNTFALGSNSAIALASLALAGYVSEKIARRRGV